MLLARRSQRMERMPAGRKTPGLMTTPNQTRSTAHLGTRTRRSPKPTPDKKLARNLVPTTAGVTRSMLITGPPVSKITTTNSSTIATCHPGGACVEFPPRDHPTGPHHSQPAFPLTRAKCQTDVGKQAHVLAPASVNIRLASQSQDAFHSTMENQKSLGQHGGLHAVQQEKQ